MVLLNSETGENIRNFKGSSDAVYFVPGGKYVVIGLKLWNLHSGQEVREFKADSYGYGYSVCLSPTGKYIASGNNLTSFRDNIIGVKLWNTQTAKEIRTLKGHKDNITSLSFSPDEKYVVSGCWDGKIKLWNTQTGQEIRTFEHQSRVTSVNFSPDGKFIMSGSWDGSVKLWDTERGILLLTLYGLNNSEDWIAVTPDGKFDGTEKGMELLYYVQGMDIIPLSSLYEQYYTPNLLTRVMAGEEFGEPEIKIDDIKLPPLVKITSPTTDGDLRGLKRRKTGGFKTSNKEIQVTVKATDQGGGIDEIRLYVNGKLAQTTQRGLKRVEKSNDVKTETFTISLTNGENKIKATAFSNQRTESIPEEITVFYEGTNKTANLHVFVIGIDNYKNPRYKLNYALADATAFKKEIEKGSNDIFGTVNITFLKDAEATRTRILQEFENYKSNAKQEDVFIFYYAGHGVMSEEAKSQFYIVPYDVTQLYGRNEMLKTKAISGNELQTFSTELKAQKQLFVFDACQSGGMTELLASRGSAEEKAISQLARSTGTYWLTASNSEQFATEFAELGHGLFTYCVLLGLQGQADGGSKDKKITVKELSSFLDDKVPELSEKHKGEAQYPSIYGYGMDFPIIIVK